MSKHSSANKMNWKTREIIKRLDELMLEKGNNGRPAKITIEEMKKLYPKPLQLYEFYPKETVMFPDLNQFVMDRLQIFRILENTKRKGHEPHSVAWTQCILTDLEPHKDQWFHRLVNNVDEPSDMDYQARRADHLSHFHVRLPFCRSVSMRTWLVTQEVDWLRLRFEMLSSNEKSEFLTTHNKWMMVSNEEKSQLKQEIEESTSRDIAEEFLWYKIPFVEIPTLVKNREVLIKGGYGFVPQSELIRCFADCYEKKLHKDLLYLSKRIKNNVDHPAITNLCRTIEKMNFDINQPLSPPQLLLEEDSITLENLDKFTSHFPMCMRYIYQALKRDHHLKHDSRLQLGLFLKGIGLSFQDAMAFWRNEFVQKMTDGEFKKRYEYFVRHMYGMVGTETQYNTPYTCSRIIESDVRPLDTHGCPFKHWDKKLLEDGLVTGGVNVTDIEDIVMPAVNGQPQVACTKLFECRYGALKVIIDHPNQFFNEAQKY